MNAFIGFIVKIDYTIKNAILSFSNFFLFSPVKVKKDIKKILIFRTGSIGDNVCAMPALSVIRDNFPDAKIDVLTNPGPNSLISLDQLIAKDFFNNIHNYFGQKTEELFRKLKDEKYDLFIELPQYGGSTFRQVRNQLFVKLLGIRHAFGWKISQTLLFKKYQEKFLTFNNERDRLVKILEENGLDIHNPRYLLGIDNKIKNIIFRQLTELRLDNKEKNIGFVVGSKLDRNKWPIENYKSLIAYFLEKGYKILIFGGAEDTPAAKQLLINDHVVSFCGKLKPLETAETLKYCTLVISNDTGPMHLTYAVGTPVIGLFSSREYKGKWYPPLNGINKIFRSEEIHCSICVNNNCNDNICIKKISPVEVIKAAENILNRN